MSVDNFILTGPVVDLTLQHTVTQVKGYSAYEAEVRFHPARVAGCDQDRLTFLIKHPDTGEQVGTIEFSTGSNDTLVVDAELFDVRLKRTLHHIKKSKGLETISCGSDTSCTVPDYSLSSAVPNLWFRVCFDNMDTDVPWRPWRRRPALARFSLSFPAACGEEWKLKKEQLRRWTNAA